MKILTLWQPWASLIAHQSKFYETRSWGTDYRGLIAIHAAKRPVVDDEVKAIYDQLRPNPALSKFVETLDKATGEWVYGRMPLGAIVAIAELRGCRIISQQPDPRLLYPERCAFINQQTPLELATGLWESGRYAWEFKNILKLPEPISWRGSQGLRDLPQEAVDLIHQQGFSGGCS